MVHCWTYKLVIKSTKMNTRNKWLVTRVQGPRCKSRLIREHFRSFNNLAFSAAMLHCAMHLFFFLSPSPLHCSLPNLSSNKCFWLVFSTIHRTLPLNGAYIHRFNLPLGHSNGIRIIYKWANYIRLWCEVQYSIHCKNKEKSMWSVTQNCHIENGALCGTPGNASESMTSSKTMCIFTVI